MMRTSSTKRSWEIKVLTTTLRPWKFPASTTLIIILLRASITSKKIKGDSRHPWRRPLWHLKKSVGVPFTRTVVLTEVMHPMIHLETFLSSPIWSNNKWRNCQLTLSYALFRSSFKITAFIFLSLAEWRHSWAIPTTSKISLSFRNPNCSVGINLASVSLI